MTDFSVALTEATYTMGIQSLKPKQICVFDIYLAIYSWKLFKVSYLERRFRDPSNWLWKIHNLWKSI